MFIFKFRNKQNFTLILSVDWPWHLHFVYEIVSFYLQFGAGWRGPFPTRDLSVNTGRCGAKNSAKIIKDYNEQLSVCAQSCLSLWSHGL